MRRARRYAAVALRDTPLTVRSRRWERWVLLPVTGTPGDVVRSVPQVMTGPDSASVRIDEHPIPLEEAFHRPAQLPGPLTRGEHERHIAAYAAYLDSYFHAYDTAVRELSNRDRDDAVAPDDERDP